MTESYTVCDRSCGEPRTVSIGKPTISHLSIRVTKKDEEFHTTATAWLTVPVARRLIAEMTQMCNEIERDE